MGFPYLLTNRSRLAIQGIRRRGMNRYQSRYEIVSGKNAGCQEKNAKLKEDITE